MPPRVCYRGPVTFLAALAAASVLAQVPEAGPARPVADPAAAAFAERLNFRGSPRERELFDALVRRVLQSPALAGLAARFAALEGSVETRFEDLPGTYVFDRKDGRLAFSADIAALATRTGEAVVLSLNRECLAVDPEYALQRCSGHLAHEALGHALGWLEAGPAGVRDAYVHYDDEHLARLIEWTLDVELGARLFDPEAWCALTEPERYDRWLLRTHPSAANAAAHPAEARRVEASALGPVLAGRAESLRRALLAKPDSFVALGDCSARLD